MSGIYPIPAPTKPKVCCSNCGKPFAISSLSPSAKRFCSPGCTAASLNRMKSGGGGGGGGGGGHQLGSSASTFPRPGGTTTVVGMKRPIPSLGPGPGPRPTSFPSGGLQTKIGDIDGESSASSMESLTTKPSPSTGNHSSDSYKPPKKKKKVDPNQGFDWTEWLSNPNFNAANVLQIKHAPLSRMWENISEGMKLEVENKDLDERFNETAYWVASVIKIQGYYVLLRYEGFGNDSSGDFWIHLCSPSIHHVGWCANKGKPLIPPKSISRKFTDWRNFLVHRLTGARTLPAHFISKLENGLKGVQKPGDLLEVVDKNNISQLKVAKVTQVVGKRLHVSYWDNDEDGGFWCHEESRLIHPTGWARTIGHNISCPPNYNPPELPTTPYDAEFENMNLQPGMKLEAIDPLNLSAICSATIKKVLRRGYVMIRVDCYDDDGSALDWFCYHISSNSVFPCGFCRSNSVNLTPPKGWDPALFTWDNYFKQTGSVPAPIRPKEKVLPHGFSEGMKIEAADLMDPKLICVATVARVVGRLLRIHFDGWEDDYDQWMDARSPDVYPIGWCELVKHRLEPPRPPPVPQKPVSKKTKKGKKKIVKGGKQTIGAKPKPSETKMGKPATVTSQANNDIKKEFPVAALNIAATVSKVSAAVKQENKGSLSLGMNSGYGNSYNGSTNNVQLPLGRAPIKTPSCDLQSNTDPHTWSILDVAQYLTANDCAAYCEFFTKNNVDGKKLMSLSKDDLVSLTGGKVGPAVKIDEMITQLKKSSAAKARSSALLK